MNRRPFLLLPAFGLLSLLAVTALRPLAADDKPGTPPPLKALLVIGGCCHDYAQQKDLLKAGLESRVNLEVEIVYTDDKGTKYEFPMYRTAEWAKGYDVVIHDECTADVKDAGFVENILAPHREGVPAVNLHCAMHSYRVGDISRPVTPGSPDALWFDLLGLQSTGHGPQRPIDVTYTDETSSITKGLENWTTVNEELYNNVKVYDTAHVLAKGKQGSAETVVVWTHAYGPKKTRVFNTTIGHNNDTVTDDRYLDLLARGLLWSVGKLTDEGKPAEGYGPVTAKK